MSHTTPNSNKTKKQLIAELEELRAEKNTLQQQVFTLSEQLETLTKQVNVQMQLLGESEHRFRAIKAELEIRVQQRIAQLSQANERLQWELLERERVEQALRESEERFRSAFDYASIRMALLGLDGRWRQVNPAICNILGYCEQELLELTFQAISHPDDLQTDLNYVQQLLLFLLGRLGGDRFKFRNSYIAQAARNYWVYHDLDCWRS
jgi:PAS domain-containing protein